MKEYDRTGPTEPDEDKLKAIGQRYMGAIAENPHVLLLQLQAYAACGDDEEIQTFVRREYAKLVELVRRLTGADDERSTTSSRWACGATSPPRSGSRTSRPNQAGSRARSPSTDQPARP